MMIALSNNPLTELSNTELLQRLDVLVIKERQITLKLILHLNEAERRSLHLERGYGSLFEYCTLHLGYSESAANRRIKTARCVRNFPEVYEMLEKNELNLTTVSKIAPILTDENKDELLSEARMKSSRYVEMMVARKNPKSVIRDRVRTVYLKTSVPEILKTAASGNGDGDGQTCQSAKSSSGQSSGRPVSSLDGSWGKFTTGAGGKFLTTGSNDSTTKQVLEKKFKLEFAVKPEFMDKIKQVKTLLSTKFPKGVEFGQLFDIMLDEYLEKHSPERKLKRREKREAREKQLPKKDLRTNPQQKQPATGQKTAKRSRHIPKDIQDAVFARDQGRCSYQGQDGVKCNSTWNLQIDHIVPFAKGGDHSINNLRLLCARHNKFEAEKIYGTEFMKRKVNNKSRRCRE